MRKMIPKIMEYPLCRPQTLAQSDPEIYRKFCNEGTVRRSKGMGVPSLDLGPSQLPKAFYGMFALISKVLLDDGNRIVNPQGLFKS